MDIEKKSMEAARYLIERLSMDKINKLTELEELVRITEQIKVTHNVVKKEKEDIEKKGKELEKIEKESKSKIEALKYKEEKVNKLQKMLSEKEYKLNEESKTFDNIKKEIKKQEIEAKNGFKGIKENIEKQYKEKLENLNLKIQDKANKLNSIEGKLEKKEKENAEFLEKLFKREHDAKLLEQQLNFKEKEIQEKEIEISSKAEKEKEEILSEIKREVENLENKAEKLKIEISNLEKEIQRKEEIELNKVEVLVEERKKLKLEKIDSEIESIRKEKLNNIEVELKDLKDKQNNYFKERDKKLTEREKEYTEREESLIEREYEADNGFRKKNEKALKLLKDKEMEVKLEIEEILKDKESTKLQIQEELKEFRKLKEENIEKELEMYKNFSTELIDKSKSEFNQWKEKELYKIDEKNKEIQEEKNSLEEKEKELEIRKKELLKNEKELEEQQEDLKDDEEDLKDNKKRFDEKVKVKAGILLEEKNNEIAQLNSEIEELRNSLKKSQEKANHYKTIHSKTGERTSEELLIEIKNLEDRNNEIEAELVKRPDSKRVLELESKLEALKNIKDEKAKLIKEVEWLREENTNKYIIENELNSKELALETIESNIETLRLEKIALDEEVSKFRKLYDQVDKIEARVEAIEKPRFEELPKAIENNSITEKQWLEGILKDCEKSGFIFSKRLLYAFHTALKTANWSIITVLLGVSGTGKSKLPELYARFGGMYFELLSVGPDWQDEIPLFGYYNSIDNRYNATELLRAMVQFSGKSKVNNLSEYMYLVLLDEMNLAHVEEYFKDMLSKLEAKRGKKSTEEVVINIDQGAGADKYKLPLTDNVLWVGTMNEDETTKSLSDKVIDRGQLISFPKPNKFASIELTDGEATTFAPANKKLKKSIWQKWQKRNVLKHEYFKQQKELYKEALERINILLEKAGITLGHRVWQSIEGYMAYHVEVTDLMLDENGDNIEINRLEKVKVDEKLTEAFEEAIVHKVMPKLRGIANNGNIRTEVIEGIRRILIDEEFAPGLLRDYDFATREENEVFLWKSASYLEVQDEEVNI